VCTVFAHKRINYYRFDNRRGEKAAIPVLAALIRTDYIGCPVNFGRVRLKISTCIFITVLTTSNYAWPVTRRCFRFPDRWQSRRRCIVRARSISASRRPTGLCRTGCVFFDRKRSTRWKAPAAKPSPLFARCFQNVHRSFTVNLTREMYEARDRQSYCCPSKKKTTVTRTLLFAVETEYVPFLKI